MFLNKILHINISYLHIENFCSFLLNLLFFIGTSDLRGETWEKHLDPASGRLFYYNKESGVTQWDEPPGFSNSKSQRLLRAVQNDSA